MPMRFSKVLIPTTLIAMLAASAGCASIESQSVRDLIDHQARKTQETAQSAKAFVEQTTARIQAYNNAIEDLNKSVSLLRTQESVFALAVGSSQAVQTKTGIDARAFVYRVGLLYLDTQAGLDKAVNDQFCEDVQAMQTLSMKIPASWESLQKLQAELLAYAGKSSLASVDAALVSVVLEQTRTNTQEIDKVIQRSKQVNSALAKAAGLALLQGEDSTKARSYLQDLIDLLERSKP